MKELTLYFATNRNHLPSGQAHRYRPDGYGNDFSTQGKENLRCGKVTLSIDEAVTKKFTQKIKHGQIGDGEGLYSELLCKIEDSKIEAYPDATLDNREKVQIDKLASTAMFKEIKLKMTRGADVLIYIHGFNVSWNQALATSFALEQMLNSGKTDQPETDESETIVFLFSWPSNGSVLDYFDDRDDALNSGKAIGRGFLRLRDFFSYLKSEVSAGNEDYCNSDINLLCHSLGNYVLQNAMNIIIENNSGRKLPKLFKHIFMCAPDVEDTIFEQDEGLERLVEITNYISLYFNEGDIGMWVSDKIKGNPKRLGDSGINNMSRISSKIHQADCTTIVKGLIEHSYYMWGRVNQDIRLSTRGISVYSEKHRFRRKIAGLTNSWEFPKE